MADVSANPSLKRNGLQTSCDVLPLPAKRHCKRGQADVAQQSDDAPPNEPRVHSALPDTVQEVSDAEAAALPDCWNTKQWSYFKKEYQWIFLNAGHVGCFSCRTVKASGASIHGMRFSTEWAEGKVGPSGAAKYVRQKQLRKKIMEHKASAAHTFAVDANKHKQKRTVVEAVQQCNANHLDATCRVFRTAYYLAKNDCPFTDHPNLIELQEVNGNSMGRVLRSNVTATEIIRHIAAEMQHKVISYIRQVKPKIAVFVDESTAVGNKPALLLYLRGAFGDQSKPVTIFFGLLELQETNALDIKTALLDYLEKAGVSRILLHEIWIAVCIDGAAVMLDKKREVAALLRSEFPNLALSWHCLAHRLELSVADTIDQVAGNHSFKSFLGSLYATYSMSSKNTRDLETTCGELSAQLQKIGKMHDTRWVASSYDTVVAVWRCFPALCAHFKDASKDMLRPPRDRSKYEGLLKKLTSYSFIKDLGLMCDALQELKELSQSLQKRDIPVIDAHRLLLRQASIFAEMKEAPGEFASAAKKALEEGQFKGNPIFPVNSSSLNETEFYESLSVKISEKCVPATDYEFIECFSVLDVENLPAGDKLVLYGESEVQTLCATLQLPLEETIQAFRCFKDSDGRMSPEAFTKLVVCMESLPARGADCEKGLCAITVIASPTRSSLASTICSCLWLKLNGPPLKAFESMSYVESWLAKGRRSAEERHCEKPQPKKDDEDFLGFWEMLK
ncbi:E3 SUMO-protein ligase KIAA1586-like [Ambystoma mexicanum]|uniref:E3 SUMO-protein ligase KIAA1586-like n=1 Tax=Ambystoma mexicanum TaxID=8296 RepID=UPI0037E9925D